MSKDIFWDNQFQWLDLSESIRWEGHAADSTVARRIQQEHNSAGGHHDSLSRKAKRTCGQQTWLIAWLKPSKEMKWILKKRRRWRRRWYRKIRKERYRVKIWVWQASKFSYVYQSWVILLYVGKWSNDSDIKYLIAESINRCKVSISHKLVKYNTVPLWQAVDAIHTVTAGGDRPATAICRWQWNPRSAIFTYKKAGEKKTSISEIKRQGKKTSIQNDQ